MKKRVKLLTTIASLCLAVALMAFGVYAAMEPITMDASGQITFTSTEISGTWEIVSATLDGEDLGFDGTTINTAEVTAGCTIVVTAKFTNTSTTVATLSSAATEGAEQGTGVAITGATDTATAKTKEADGSGTVICTIKYTNADLTQDAGANYYITFSAIPAGV